jgi:hypothetical protein
VPTQPIEIIRRSPRWAAQRGLLDTVIDLIGPARDQDCEHVPAEVRKRKTRRTSRTTF